mmetsp:Transcript_36266/g.65549  ORF Transcript_36266/g.65549 Transcript_36266/m.65549 type:complete len:114 (-) Transcript_36266:67-408(-)
MLRAQQSAAIYAVSEKSRAGRRGKYHMVQEREWPIPGGCRTGLLRKGRFRLESLRERLQRLGLPGPSGASQFVKGDEACAYRECRRSLWSRLPFPSSWSDSALRLSIWTWPSD